MDFSEPGGDQLALALCDSCGSKPAVVWCEADCARLCATCDQDLHSLNKIVAKHVRVPIFEQPRHLGCCKEHPGEEIFRYCESCAKPLCGVCLSTGSHSAPGIVETHAIVPLQDAYRMALRKNASTDGRLVEKQTTIKKSLLEIEDFVNKVQDSGKISEERIYTLVQDCLDRCQRLTESSLKTLLCDEIDLKRQLHLVDYLDGFMRQQMLELSKWTQWKNFKVE